MPWLVTLIIGGLIVAPFMIGAHWRHSFSVTGRVVTGLIFWIALAAFFRFIVFLADYFRWGPKSKWPHVPQVTDNLPEEG